MSSKSALLAIVSLLHGDSAETLAQLSEAFKKDYSHIARANNRDALESAISALKKSPKDKAIAEAIAAGVAAGALVQGYIGARTGSFASQPDDVRAVFEDAITRASLAFDSSLVGAEVFAPKVEKTKEEKATAKAEKAEKAEKAMNDLITAKIQSGELIRASDVKTLADAGPLALAETLQSLHVVGGISPQAYDIIGAIVGVPNLIAELDTLRAELLALRLSMKPKTKKPTTA